MSTKERVIIEKMQVEIRYAVELDDVKVSNKIYKGLLKIASHGGVSNHDHLLADEEVKQAFDWLNKNAKQSNALSWCYALYDLNEEDEI